MSKMLQVWRRLYFYLFVRPIYFKEEKYGRRDEQNEEQ